MTGFKKAEKKKIKLKLALTGPSGAGKTFSALRLAKGLGGKLAVIDTENGSASLYSDKFDFDVLELSPPYETAKYIAALKQAEEAGYHTVIIDSATHAWSGPGGILDRKEQKDQRGGNSYANWNFFTKEHNAFMTAILHSPLNVITTMRSKQAHEIVEENNRKTVKKLGLKSEQRDGVEYEFTVVFDVAMSHTAEASKDRTDLFKGKIFQVTEETGKMLNDWLNSGKDECAEVIAKIEKKLKIIGSNGFRKQMEDFIDKDGNDKRINLLKNALARIEQEIDHEEIAANETKNEMPPGE